MNINILHTRRSNVIGHSINVCNITPDSCKLTSTHFSYLLAAHETGKYINKIMAQNSK